VTWSYDGFMVYIYTLAKRWFIFILAKGWQYYFGIGLYYKLGYVANIVYILMISIHMVTYNLYGMFPSFNLETGSMDEVDGYYVYGTNIWLGYSTLLIVLGFWSTDSRFSMYNSVNGIHYWLTFMYLVLLDIGLFDDHFGSLMYLIHRLILYVITKGDMMWLSKFSMFNALGSFVFKLGKFVCLVTCSSISFDALELAALCSLLLVDKRYGTYGYLNMSFMKQNVFIHFGHSFFYFIFHCISFIWRLMFCYSSNLYFISVKHFLLQR